MPGRITQSPDSHSGQRQPVHAPGEDQEVKKGRTVWAGLFMSRTCEKISLKGALPGVGPSDNQDSC